MNTYDNRPIGVFDSGVGGLTVVNEISQILPNEDFIYFGDTARTPYGSKSIETLKSFTLQIADFLVKNNVKMIVVACNTVSATCLGFIKIAHPHIPTIGMIGPTAKHVASVLNESENHVGIIGTRVTVKSQQYEQLIHKLNKNSIVHSKACPLFVPIIEEGVTDTCVIKPIIKYYLDDFIKTKNIDTLVLGCTHYPLIIKEIKSLYPNINIINPSKIVAHDVRDYLYLNNMLSFDEDHNSRFYASDLSDKFMDMASAIMGERKVEVEQKIFGGHND